MKHALACGYQSFVRIGDKFSANRATESDVKAAVATEAKKFQFTVHGVAGLAGKLDIVGLMKDSDAFPDACK